MKQRKTSARNELIVSVMGIGCIFFLELFALYKGINGIMFGAAMSGIGGIAGYMIKSHIKE